MNARRIEAELPPPLRQRQKEQTRANVLMAARRLFEAEGFQRVTVRMIAEAAGVAVGSVFTGFASKEELLEEIIIEDVRHHVSEAAGHVNALPREAVAERLVGVFQASLEYHRAHVAKIRESLAYSWVRGPEAEARTRREVAAGYRLLRRVFEEGVAAGKVSPTADIRRACDMLFWLCYNITRKFAFDGWSAEQGLREMRAYADIILAGMSAERTIPS